MWKQLGGIVWLLALALPLALLAQTPTGIIQGMVTDASGGAVPSAKVRIVNVNTGEAKELNTDQTGRYVQPFLLPGTYEVTVEAAGFSPARQEDVRLNVGQNRSVDFVLEVGTLAQEVRVEATAAPLDLNSATVGQVIDNKRIVDLPLVTRSVFALTYLTPGVNPTGPNAATPGLGGSRNAISEIQIDGVTNIAPDNNPGINQRVYEPQVDAVEEFSVQINALAAEYGRFGGGVINVVTKSGTNQFRGTAYNFLRNSVLNANDFFANRAGLKRGSFKRNQYGFTAGGPITLPGLYSGRDKSFFFVGFEGTNARTQSVYTATVPPAAWKTGDFSDLRTAGGAPITIFDPATVTPDPNVANRFNRAPFPGNRIPADRINPVALKALSYWPAPNTAPVNPYTFANNFNAAGSAAADSYRVDSRLDHNFSPAWRMFGRFSTSWYDNTPFNPWGNVGTPTGNFGEGGAYSVALDNTITINPSLLANLRYGFGRNVWKTIAISKDFNPSELGFPAAYSSIAARNMHVFPRFDFSGVAASIGMAGWVPGESYAMVHSLTGTLTKIMARHTIKTGVEYRKLLLNYKQFGFPSGQYSFNPAWTQREVTTPSSTQGFPIASFLLGLPASGQMSHDPIPAGESWYSGFYIQDDWKVTRRLTLNIGLRYELDVPRTERFNQLSVFDMTAVSPLAGKVPASACPHCGDLRGQFIFMDENNRRQVPINKLNFGPRFGFAYDLGIKMAIRGGYGIAYPPSPFQAAGSTGATGMDGFRTTSSFIGSLDDGRTIEATLSNPFPNGFNLPTGRSLGALALIGQGFSESVFDSRRSSYVQQWNLNIQREMPGNMVVEIGYIGNRGVALVDGDGGRLYSQLPASYLRFGAALTQLVPNPFFGVITDPTSPLSRPTIQFRQLERPFPHYNGVSSFRKPGASSTYHGMTIRADRRFANGFSFLLAYTAGKGIDDASNAVGYLGQIPNTRLDAYNWRLERSVSAQDIAQRLVMSYVYELPFGRGKPILSNVSRLADLLISGWQINGITTIQRSGLPLIIFAQQNNTFLFTRSQRPNNNGTSAKITGGTTDERLQKWFDTSVFSQPPSYTLGNTSRTLPDVRGPGLFTSDLSLFKNAYLGRDRRYTVQYRLEMFNAFNTPQFGMPGTTIGAGTFGVITSTSQPPRNVQMALKVIW